jgi:hypothetical protein
MRPSTPKIDIGRQRLVVAADTYAVDAPPSEVLPACAFACALLKASAQANNGPANRVMPVYYELNSVPPRPASSRVDKFDRRRFADPQSVPSAQTVDQFIQNGLDASPTHILHFATRMCSTTQFRRLPIVEVLGTEFERGRRLDGKKCARGQGLWGEASHAMS